MPNALIYLGRRGAGEVFTREIFRNGNFDLVLLSSNLDSKSNYSQNGKNIHFIKLYRHRFNYLVRYLFPGALLKQVQALLDLYNIDNVVFPMLSPFDVKLLKLANKNGIKTTSIIHDPQRHPGDIWPYRTTIKYIYITSDRIICLSQYTMNQLEKNFGQKRNVHFYPHPILTLRGPFSGNRKLGNAIVEPYSLFIGRIRTYKGLDTLLKAWSLLVDDNKWLVVAGEGRINRKMKKTKNVIFLNKWLDEVEFINLIKRSHTVIFPYRSASQSGVLPIAMSMNKHIVITNSGGLVEQSDGYNHRTIVTEPHISGLKEALENLIITEPSVIPETLDTDIKIQWKNLSELLQTNNL